MHLKQSKSNGFVLEKPVLVLRNCIFCNIVCPTFYVNENNVQAVPGLQWACLMMFRVYDALQILSELFPRLQRMFWVYDTNDADPTEEIWLQNGRMEENNSPHISTFCRGLDNILGGGFAIGSITELAGSPGIGKTQLCLQACISVQFPPTLGGLGGESVFIDTEGKFSAVRLKDIAVHAVQRVKTMTTSLDVNLEPTVESLLRGIHYYRCYNCLEVLAAVRRVCALQKECQRIKLLVIDSIAYPFLYDDYESELVGLKSFTTQELQELVNNHNMAVIITNYLTIRGDGHSVDLVGELGEMWGHYPTVRLILHWESGERVASVTKAPHLCNAAAKYEVRVAGIEDIESIAVCNSFGIKKEGLKRQPLLHSGY
ncbi:DNA repair protein RAD51 homolog 3-like isoform X1 [Macrobrachium rosenbergii]|uniref:DNA repair protein RAD51 homolog 3-like isoform X1 n=1 Tax=Macrobrachium rosenbergii TaxID=79674 RepID=UPI0034D4822B